MGHKKAGVRLGLSLLAVAIVVPLASRVNHLAQNSVEQAKSRVLRADGNPIPPLPPPKATLVADGNPIPPLPPPKGTGGSSMGVLVADGNPIPPLPPPKGSSEQGSALPA
jgi:hypothetical protein